MKITAIGHGGAFAPISIGNSNFLFEEDGKYFLFDCSIFTMHILREEMKFDIGDIDALYITHQHFDHHGGGPYLGLYRYFVPNSTGKPVRPKLFIASSLIESLWNSSWKGDLEGLHGRIATLTDYFDCRPIQKSKTFIWQGIKFTPFQTVHVNSGFAIKNSYGLFIENPKTGKTGMISGDTIFNPDGLDYIFQKSDIIFHDCETSPFRSKVHANIEDLRTLPVDIKKKMWLYHYNDKVDGTGFAGFVEKSQIFEI